MSDKQQELRNNLLEQADLLSQITEQGVSWTHQFMKDREGLNLRVELKRNRRMIRKTKAALSGKPVLGLFGASQVGKSYMANNLLYNQDNLLLIHNHQNGEAIDFIKRINPEGKGNEATSTVTRFTSTRLTDKSRKPVHLKLFSAADVITILCDSYLSDYIDSSERLQGDAIRQYTEAIRSYANAPSQTYLTDDDIYDIQEYIEKYFQKSLTEFLSGLQQANFWNVLAEHIDRIAPNDWVKVLDILWNKNAAIGEMLQLSLRELEKSGYAREAYVDFTAVDRDGVNGNAKAIINVKTLEGFFGEDDGIVVQLSDGMEVSLSASKLCFLTAEIVLTVSQESVSNRPFIEQTDIVDFPGARSREELRDLSETSKVLMLLRGKVSYLFNHYSSNFKTNTLFVCMRTQQTNVTTMPRLINQWIEDNLGGDMVTRGKNITYNPPPLFIVFTWWNTQLQYKDKTDNMNPLERIEKQFETRFQQEVIGNYKWHSDWISQDGHKSRFQNFYLLRDFKESEGIYESTNGQENGFVGAPQQEFYERYRTEFLDYRRQNGSFFADAEASFDEASTPNNDGSERVIRHLNLIPFQENFVRIHSSRLQETLDNTSKLLRKYYHTDESDKLIRQAVQHASEIHMVMNMIFGKDTYHFGGFIEKMQLNEKDIFEMNHDILNNLVVIDRSKVNEMIHFKLASPRLRLGETPSPEIYQENLAILMEDYNRDSLEDAEAFFSAKGIDLNELFFGQNTLPNKSDELAENAAQFWFDKILNADRFSYFIDLGFDRSLLEKLLKNMRNSFRKHGLQKMIAQEIQEFVDLDKKLDDAEDMVAHIITSVINEFVTNMGWSHYSEEERNSIRQASQSNKLNLRFPADQGVFRAPAKLAEEADGAVSVERIVEIMDRMNEKLSKSRVDDELIQGLPMIRSFNQWIDLMKVSFVANCDIPNYDIQANKSLGETLKHFEKVNLS